MLAPAGRIRLERGLSPISRAKSEKFLLVLYFGGLAVYLDCHPEGPMPKRGI
jgi:hypothetical protein